MFDFNLLENSFMAFCETEANQGSVYINEIPFFLQHIVLSIILLVSSNFLVGFPIISSSIWALLLKQINVGQQC